MKTRLRSEFDRRQKMRENKTYEIFYYSDSHFQNVNAHTHDYYEFYFPVAGEIAMEINGRKTPLSHRDVVAVPPYTSHRALTSSERSYCRYIFWISAAYLNRLRSEDPDCWYITEAAEKNQKFIHHFSENEYAVIQSKILRLMEEDRSSRFGSDVFVTLCIRDLLLTISRLAYEQDHPKKTEAQKDVFQGIVEYIEQHLDEDLSLSKIGKVFFLSKYHIAHLFQDRIGVSVHQYILKKRLERCAVDIASGKSISRVYSDHGFNDYSSFYRAFKKEYFISPKEYQAVHLQDPLRDAGTAQ
ncbi:MAG: helix-turn-helix domain-containing protein [Solobacterium sp.]|jgi:AraC-like DNA-binding protein|nr:helix-turn-helix domain-containing protein [Solobacterium sp.]